MHIVSLSRLRYFCFKNQSYEKTGTGQPPGGNAIPYSAVAWKRKNPTSILPGTWFNFLDILLLAQTISPRDWWKQLSSGWGKFRIAYWDPLPGRSNLTIAGCHKAFGSEAAIKSVSCHKQCFHSVPLSGTIFITLPPTCERASMVCAGWYMLSLAAVLRAERYLYLLIINGIR